MIYPKYRKYGLYAGHVIAALFFLFPILWALSTSLKTSEQVLAYPPEFIPSPITLDNYSNILTIQNNLFFKMFINSTIVTTLTALLVSAISTFAGYAFAYFNFKGKEFIFVCMLSTILVPFQGLLIPLFDLMRSLKLLNTYTCLIVIYTTFQLPFGIFMMRNSFAALPSALRESSYMDGGSELKTMWFVMLPLALPGILTTIVYSVYVTWNDFLIALVFNVKGEMTLLPVGLRNFSIGQFGTQWETLMAGTIISFIPVILLYAWLQQYFIKGITGSAMKE